jgi:hypothetical protein
MECGVSNTLNIMHDNLVFATEEDMSQKCLKNVKHLMSPLKETDKGWHEEHV